MFEAVDADVAGEAEAFFPIPVAPAMAATPPIKNLRLSTDNCSGSFGSLLRAASWPLFFMFLLFIDCP
jgi:hypothetical protein